MAVRVELWEARALVAGVQEWWDGVERALLTAEASTRSSRASVLMVT
jgi:hypothetical protein